MKYQRLVSNTIPFSVLMYLEDRLGECGIDAVFARYIISILEQDCDVEPCEHYNTQKQCVKELPKCGGRQALHSLPKSKKRKWEKWDKQSLLFPSPPPCSYNKTCLDAEKLKKDAAVEFLRSICDGDDVESVINEVYHKLKNYKNQNGEKSFGKVNTVKIEDSFYIAPSSPTDEIEKYFAAFPPLNSKVEENTDLNTINVGPWYKSDSQEQKYESKVMLLSSPHKQRVAKKNSQPVIPYGSLKSIKNVYKCNIAQMLATEVNFECIEKGNCSDIKSHSELLDINSSHNVKMIKCLAQKYVLLRVNHALLKPCLQTSLWKFLVTFNGMEVNEQIQEIFNNVKNKSIKNFGIAINVYMKNLLTNSDKFVLKSEEDVLTLDIKFSNSMNIFKGEITESTVSAKIDHCKCLSLSYEFIMQIFSRNLSPYDMKGRFLSVIESNMKSVWPCIQKIEKNIAFFKMNFCCKCIIEQLFDNIYFLFSDCNNSKSLDTKKNVCYEIICELRNSLCFTEESEAHTSVINENFNICCWCEKNKSCCDFSSGCLTIFENFFKILRHDEFYNNKYFLMKLKLFIKDIFIFLESHYKHSKYTDLLNFANNSAALLVNEDGNPDNSFIVRDFQIHGKFYFNEFQEKNIVSNRNILDFGYLQPNIPFLNKVSLFPLLNNNVNYLEYEYFSINTLNSPLKYVYILNTYLNAQSFETVDDYTMSKINHDDYVLSYKDCEKDLFEKEKINSDFSDSGSVSALGSFIGYKPNLEINSFDEDMIDLCLKKRILSPEKMNLHVTSEKESLFALKSEGYLMHDDSFNLKYDSHEKYLSSDRNARFPLSDNLIEAYSKNILRNLKFGENFHNSEIPNLKCDMLPSENLYAMGNLNSNTELNVKLKESSNDDLLSYIADSIHEIQNDLSYLSDVCANFNYERKLESKFSFCKPDTLPNNTCGDYGTFSRHQFYSELECNIPYQHEFCSSDFEQLAENSESSSDFTSDLFQLSSKPHVDVDEGNFTKFEKKWLFYWGENHINVERTWQSDFISPLKRDDSYPQILINDTHIGNMGRNTPSNLNVMLNSSQEGIQFSQNDYLQETVALNSSQEEINFQKNNYDLVFHPENIVESKNINICCENENQIYIPDNSGQSNIFNSSAFYPCSNYDIWQTNVFETNEWSNNSNDYIPLSYNENTEAFSEAMPMIGHHNLDFKYEYSFDSSYDMKMVPEQFELEYSDELSITEINSTLESNENDVIGTSEEFLEYYVDKRQKRRPHLKRPCCFYLQGNCSRPNCKYSHDVSHITCRFWEEGSCFKGELCPFLHGYVRYTEESLLDDSILHEPYSLESETDFPSLECAKNEAPKDSKESNPVNIVQDKLSRKKRKKKFLQTHSPV